MKKKEWATPNRMKFESLHKTFNRQISMITTGNQIGNTVLSSYIRPYNKTECNGFTRPLGHLQEYDLGWIVKEAPEIVKDWVRQHGREKSFIVYLFFHWRNGTRIIHGAVITDSEHNHARTFYLRSGYKSQSIIDEARKYITN